MEAVWGFQTGILSTRSSSVYSTGYRTGISSPSQLHSTAEKPDTTGVVPSLKGVPYRITQLIDADDIEAVNIRHISVATLDLANEVHSMLRSGASSFRELAETLSLCAFSNNKGGELGWVNPQMFAVAEDAIELKMVVPPEVVNRAYHMNKGDTKVIRSLSLDGNEIFHVVQLMDVETKMNPQLRRLKKRDFLAKKNRKPGDSMKYFLDTMGCQMNVADSQRMEGQLQEFGYRRIDEPQDANIVITNTCAIRDKSEQKLYSYLGKHHMLRKERGDDLTLVVAGCVAQQEGEKLLRRFPEIDIVMGPQYVSKFGKLLEAVADGNQVVATDPQFESEDRTKAFRTSDVCAYVSIIYGCNERCSYCVVPNTRGIEQSRTLDAIIKEMSDLAAQGYKEVTLLGQNIDSWGRDFSPKQRFADLLTAAGQVDGIERVRFLTSHPKYMSKRVISAVADNFKLMPCFNIPFQSGDDRILSQMRRGYTHEKYMSIIDNIKELVPDAAITADCIVGFPGETEEQFQRTLELMEKVGGFEQLNTAAYSARPNTPAALWQNQVDEVEKQNRLQRINRLATEHAMQRSLRFVERVEDVLVEDVSVKDPRLVWGRIPHGRLIYFPGDIAKLKGSIVPIRVTEAKAYSLIGTLVEG